MTHYVNTRDGKIPVECICRHPERGPEDGCPVGTWDCAHCESCRMEMKYSDFAKLMGFARMLNLGRWDG